MLLHEAEAATARGIAFDENWYSISPTARAYMIASTMARNILDNMNVKQARNKL